MNVAGPEREAVADDQRAARACPGCGVPAVGRRVPRAPQAVRRCPGCGLLRTAPFRTDAELADLYDDSYFSEWLRAMPAGPGGIEHALRDHEPRARFLAERSSPGVLLDVGAATGMFLVSARELGWSVEGVEPSVPAWEWARATFGLGSAPPTIFEIEGTARFDAITFWHTLEHHARPDLALAHAAELLRPGGLLLVEVPNASALDRWLGGPRWPGWHLPFHTVHYTPRTMRAALARAGLEVEEERFAPSTRLAALGRSLAAARRGSAARGGAAEDGPGSPFLLRAAPGSKAARVARAASGLEMLFVTRKPATTGA